MFVEKHNCDFFLSQFLNLDIFILICCILVVLFLLFYFRNSNRNKTSDIGVLLVMIGGLLNTVERLRSGCVRDYLNFFDIFYFNIWDLLVTVGVTLVLVNIWKTK